MKIGFENIEDLNFEFKQSPSQKIADNVFHLASIGSFSATNILDCHCLENKHLHWIHKYIHKIRFN